MLELSQQLVECATCFPDLDLELDCPPGLAAYADPLRLQQILANLVRNAQKHGAEPVLIAAAPDPASRAASRSASPTPAPACRRRSSRGSSSATARAAPTATGGSGLGLSVVRDLVSAHHGTVRYDLAGNVFVFTLPPASLYDAMKVSAPTPAPRSANVPTGP